MLTSLAFLSPGQEFPPPSEKKRLDDYERYSKLFDGDLAEAFAPYVQLLRDDQKATLQVTVNLFKRIPTLFADIVYSEKPTFSVGDPDSGEQAYLDGLLGDDFVDKTLYSGAIDHLRYGDNLYKIRRVNGRSVIVAQTPKVWYPVVDPSNTSEAVYQVLAWTEPQSEAGVLLLTAEIHTQTTVELRYFRVKDGKIESEIAPPSGEPLIETHGGGDFLIQDVPNLPTTDRPTGVSDYKDAETIIREMSVRLSQISAILDLHASPGMTGSESALERDPETGKVRVKPGKYIPYEQGEPKPEYVVFDGKLEAAFSALEELWKAFYVVTETSPAVFGQLESGFAESGSALKRLLIVPLWKASRIRSRQDSAIRKSIAIAAALDQEAALIERRSAPEIGKLTIVWRDGLPADQKEAAETVKTKREAAVQSVESAVRELNPDADEKTITAEIAAIEAEQTVPAPDAMSLDSIFGKTPTPPGSGDDEE